MSDLQKNAIITGAYGAIGQAIAMGVAAKGFRVTLVGRDNKQLERVQKLLIQSSSNPSIFIEIVDLSLQKEIVEFSKRWSGKLALLINNAATAPRKRTETSEGIEVQWATNVLGYFWMIHYFSPFLENLSDARIVNVASYWAGGMNMRDPEFKSRAYNNDEAYRQAKQANRMLSAAFAGRLKSKGIAVNSCHPGDVNSKLSNAFGFGGSESPAEGAATPLFLSLSEEVGKITGKYYEHMKPVACPFSKDQAMIEELFHQCSLTVE
ncbi:MAG: SDR family NAD(P)-dependent oxidoreductase [Bacteroidetes bacterium]|nr:SDR family NAD(P)-dependent oxidoreductase [Bacteroidota bacterium]